MVRVIPARRLLTKLIFTLSAGCTTIVGIDKDYQEVPGSGGLAGIGGGPGAGGNSTSAGGASTAGSTGTAGDTAASGAGGDVGTTTSTGTAGVLVDAGAGGGDASPDVESNCGPGTKACGLCVSTSDPSYGCAAASCAPCEPHGTASCTGGNCVVTACNTGYHLVGNQCLSNTIENCSNGADDDGDNRVDCLDTDCSTNTACANKCIDAKQLGCDTILTGQSTSATGSTQRITSYSCTTMSYGGSEYAYKFTGSANQDVFIEIYGLNGNLGIFDIDVATGTQCATSSCTLYGDAMTSSAPEALGFTAQQGRDYYLVVDGAAAQSYSLSLQCATSGGCRPTKAIGAGESVSGNNNPTSGASNVTSNKVGLYDCYSLAESGPEAAWMFTPTVTASYTVRVSNLDNDCDLFVLSSNNCNGACLSSTSKSTSILKQDEVVTFNGVANTTYYIVVEGYAGHICNFTLSVTQL